METCKSKAEDNVIITCSTFEITITDKAWGCGAHTKVLLIVLASCKMSTFVHKKWFEIGCGSVKCLC
jgi:hypothetical protein